MYFPLPFVFRFEDPFHKQSPSLFVVCLSMCPHLQHFMLRSSWNKMDARVNRYLLQSVTLFLGASLENSLCDSQTKTQRETHTQSHTDVSPAKAAPHEPVVSPQTFVTVLMQRNTTFMVHLLFSLQQKPPNNDWRFNQGQRPGPSG